MTGVALTKLDGSAKGGVAVAIVYELGLPVKLVGVGEGLDDLRPFDPREFARALVACLTHPCDVRLRRAYLCEELFSPCSEARCAMAVTLIMRVPELMPSGTTALIAELELDANPPAGLILHVASDVGGGIHVCEIWQTRQAAESFVEHRLQGALDRQGVKGTPSFRIESLHNLFVPELDMVARIGGSSLPLGIELRAIV